MPKIQADGLELVQVITGIHRYQREKLEEFAIKYGKSRAELIREAIDLLVRGEERREARNVEHEE